MSGTHEHVFERRPGVYWAVKCRTQDCHVHQQKDGGLTRNRPRMDCPQGCGLAFYPHESAEHSCWDS